MTDPFFLYTMLNNAALLIDSNALKNGTCKHFFIIKVYSEFDYNEHPAITNKVSTQGKKFLIDINVKKVQLQRIPPATSKFL